MAICPRAVWRPIPENATQPRIKPTQVINHSAWDGANTTTLFHWWDSPGNNLESHFYVAGDGLIEQYVDTEVRADANNRANGRAISIEAWDGAASFRGAQPYTSAQVESLAWLCDWLCTVHNIPRDLAPKWDAPGLGWHRMFPEWAAGGATACPGEPRINQLSRHIYPALSRPQEVPTVPATPTKVIAWTKPGSKWVRDVAGLDPAQGHAFMLYANDESRWLHPSDVDLNRFLGIGDMGPLDDQWFVATTLKPREKF